MSRRIPRKNSEKCTEPLLRDELCFEALLIINITCFYFITHYVKALVAFSPCALDDLFLLLFYNRGTLQAKNIKSPRKKKNTFK